VKPDPDQGDLAPPLELAPCDAEELVAMEHPEPDFVLKMEHQQNLTFATSRPS